MQGVERVLVLGAGERPALILFELLNCQLDHVLDAAAVYADLLRESILEHDSNELLFHNLSESVEAVGIDFWSGGDLTHGVDSFEVYGAILPWRRGIF